MKSQKVDGSKAGEPMSRKRSTIILVIGGYFNTGIQIVQALLLVPLYVHFIGLHLYGLWLSSGGILIMLGVLNFGVGNLLTQRVAQAYGRQDLQGAGSSFKNGLAVYLILVAILTGLGLLISLNLDHLLTGMGADKRLLRGCFQLALLATAIAFVNDCLRSFANALLRPTYMVLTVASARVTGLVVTLSLLFEDAGLWAIPVGLLISEGIALLFGAIKSLSLYRELGSNFRLSLEQIKEYFNVGGMLFLARLGNALSRDADPLFISFFFRPEATAAYMITRRAADVVFQLVSIIISSMFGSFSHLAGAGDEKRTGWIAAKLLVISFFISSTGYVAYVALNSSFIKLWVGDIFVLDQQVVMLIGLAYLLNSLRNMVLNLLNGLGEFRLTSRIVILEGIVKIILVLLLLGWFGVSGAPLSLAVVSLATLIFFGLALHNKISIPIPSRVYIKSFTLCAGLYILAAILHTHIIASSWGRGALIAAACVATIFLLLLLPNIKFVRGMWHNRTAE